MARHRGAGCPGGRVPGRMASQGSKSWRNISKLPRRVMGSNGSNGSNV
jgi:hypothetical protein